MSTITVRIFDIQYLVLFFCFVLFDSINSENIQEPEILLNIPSFGMCVCVCVVGVRDRGGGPGERGERLHSLTSEFRLI